MKIVQRYIIVGSAVLVAPLAALAQSGADTSSIEIAAVQGLVWKFKAGTVTLDPTLPARSQDNLVVSERVRPRQRQQALVAALRSEIFHSDSLPVTVRATEPVISGDEARITVRVSRVVPPRPKEEWETVAVGRLEWWKRWSAFWSDAATTGWFVSVCTRVRPTDTRCGMESAGAFRDAPQPVLEKAIAARPNRLPFADGSRDSQI